MNMVLTMIAAILAVLAAIVAGHAALLARPIKPDLGKNLRDLANIVSDTFSSTSLFLSTLRSALGKKDTKWPDEALSQAVIALENVARTHADEVKRIEEFKVRDFSKSELEALGARAWIELGTILASLSAAIQLFVLYRQFAEKG